MYVCLFPQLYEAVLLYDYCMDNVFTELVLIHCLIALFFLKSEPQMDHFFSPIFPPFWWQHSQITESGFIFKFIHQVNLKTDSLLPV